MEKLADLPPAALITFGVTLAVIFAVQRFGLWSGQKAVPSESSAQVAAVIVDPAALNRAAEAGEGMTKAIDADARRREDHTHMLCRRIEANTDAVEGLTGALSALTLEIARRTGR